MPQGARRCCPVARQCLDYSTVRLQSTAAAPVAADIEVAKKKRGRPKKDGGGMTILQASVGMPSTATQAATDSIPPKGEQGTSFGETRLPPQTPYVSSIPLEDLPSPYITAKTSSAKLSALHARLALPSRLPIQTLARTLIDRTAEPDARFNNESLAVLGHDLLTYYMAEHLLCHYPRLPMAVLYAAQFAYVGEKALESVVREWGVEVAAEPGGEVDPGLLQFRRTRPGTTLEADAQTSSTRPDKFANWRRGISSRVVYDDAFGDLKTSVGQDATTAALTTASSTFLRALFGAIYLHTGASATQTFFRDHVVSRKLDLADLFTFTQPTRDLSRLCAREGFEAPVARLESETGRLSRHPVFVVGVYSALDKLGEGAGASLNEARFKAAVAALKGWYLYSPAGAVTVPSSMEGERGRGRIFKPAVVDDGEIIV